MDASPRSSTHETQQTPAATTDDACYRLIAQIILKETESGRDNKGHVFGLQVFQASSFLSLKQKLWSFVFDYVQPLAHYTGLPKVWSIQTTPPSIADFDTYVSFKLNKQVIPTEDKLKKRFLKNKNETFIKCIDPVSVDRAGAADEQQQQEIVEQLRAYWGEHYEAFDATWRMWASHIHTKRAQHNVAREIQRAQPTQLLHLFTAKTRGFRARIAEFEQNTNMAVDIVESCLEDHARLISYWKTAVESMELRFDAIKESLVKKRRCLQSFARDLPCRDDTAVLALHTIPNLPDLDRAYENDNYDDERV
ncbi:hypothetical protein LEN26_018818 [Aphanomyces euteiches]|nr:hypothetical protein LEN26_018818 [Aphanomyces euteiches]KAH9102730.1 hypothetical protein AeMF1_020739 [Aphanomyces euteiches]KAH9117892.1 hypothetical protein AeMF1_008692 [Aphanomyces euteiches]